MGEAQSAKREKHYHLLKRHKYRNGEEVYFCVLNCKFKCNVKLSLGKVVLCNVCRTPFTINEKSIRLARPKCNDCIESSPKALRSKKKKEIITTEDLGLNLEVPSLPSKPKLDLESRLHLLRNPSSKSNTLVPSLEEKEEED